MNNGFSKIFVAIFFIALLVSLPVNPLAVPSAGAQVFDPNTNLGKQLVKEVRGDTYLTKEYSDSTAESTFGLPEWIPDDNGNYKPYIIMENNDAYVIENKYLPMGINKSNCMTTFYLNNENILDGADTLIENQYWEVYHKENETDNYQLLDTSSWDCDTSFNTSSKQFSIFTTWDKSHGDIPLAQSQYDTTSTNSTGTFYFRTLSETTNNPTMSQQTVTNSTGTFTVDVWTDNFTTTTENIPVIPDELISTFEVEYRYMLETGDVESFTRIINNDANMENHYFQFVNKFDGVNYNSFNLGDDIEFTDASYIGSYYALAENVPDKYIQIAEQGYPLYYSLEKGEEWWESASATIYMDGAEKKLNVQVDFGKDRTPLPLNTEQELDPTLSYVNDSTSKQTRTDAHTGSTCNGTATSFGTAEEIYKGASGSSDRCMWVGYEFDVSSISSAIVTNAQFKIDNASRQGDGANETCYLVPIDEAFSTITAQEMMDDIEDNTPYTSSTFCQSTGTTGTVLDLGTTADSNITTDIETDGLFQVGLRYSTTRDSVDNNAVPISNAQLQVTYEIPTVTAPPTNLAGADASTSAINLSWTAPSTASASIPAVTGYRIQSSDFAYANSSLPTGRTADSDTYGALTGDVDMVNANLYLSMNGTQSINTSDLKVDDDFSTDLGWLVQDSNVIDIDTTGEEIDFQVFRDGSNNAMTYDLGTTVSDTQWVMRYVMNLSTNTASGENWFWVGLTDKDSSNSTTETTSLDGFGNFIMYEQATDAKERHGITSSTASGVTEHQAYDTNVEFSTGTDYYFELIRTSATTGTSTIRTGSHDGATHNSYSYTGGQSSTDLRYLRVSDLTDTAGGTANMIGTIDNLQFCDGQTTFANCSETVMLDESYRGNHGTLSGSYSSTQSSGSTGAWQYLVNTGQSNWYVSFQGQEFNTGHELIGETINSISFDLSKNGSPASNVKLAHLDSSNTVTVLENITVSDISSSGSGSGNSANFSTLTFNSFTPFVLSAGDKLGIHLSGTIGGNSGDSGCSASCTYIELAHTNGSDVIANANKYQISGSWDNGDISGDIKYTIGYAPSTSKDTDLNFEGTNSAVFDGSTRYMTLPSDNTIISTTGAFTLGTWIKPDRIVEITVNEGYSSGFTTVGSTVIIDSNHVKSQNSPTNADHRQHKALGTTLDNEKFLVKFDFDYDSNTSSTLPLALTSSTGNMHTASHDALGVFMDGGNLNIWYKDGSGSYTSSGSTQAISSGTQYYLEFARTSSTTTTLKVFTDSSFTTQHGSTLTQTVPSTVQGLTTLQHGTWTSAGGSSGQTWEIANTKIYDGITSANDQTIFSYPSSAGSVDFNIEGSDLEFRSGDKNNDPIITRTHGMNEGSWNNVAVSRDGSNNFEIFVNGTRVGAVASNSTAINAKTSGENYYIGLSASPPSADYSFTNNGATSGSTGKLGNAWDFEDGEGDYIDTTNLLTNNAMGSTGTVSFWYKQESHQGSYLWSVGDSDGNTDRIYIEQQATNKWVVTAQYGSGTSAWKVDSTTSPAFADDTWYHVVVTHDGGSSYGAVKLWINGVDRSTNSNNGSVWNKWVGDLTNIDNMRFGNHNHNNLVYTQYADGLYDDIGIWDRALTSAEVASLYNSGTGAVASTISSGLKAYYPLDDSSLTNKALENSNYFDGKMDEMYVLSTQSDTVIDNISSRGENSWTDLSYNTGGTGTTYSHTGISGGSGTYQSYRVSAHNSVGLSGFDLAEESTSSTPSVPQSLAVAPQMNGDTFENKLTWSNPASEGGSSISSFKVYRGTSSGFTANSGSLITTLGDVFTYTDSGLDGRTSYYYIVSAVNTQGEGTKTSEVQGTTKNFNVIVKGVRFDNSTALAGYVLQTNSTSANNKFTFNSTGFTIGRTLSDGTIDGSDRMTGLYGNQNFTMFDTGNSFTVKKIVNKNIAENKVTNDSWVHAQSNVFDIDCSSNGAGSDVRLYVNGTIGHVQTMTTPSCDSDNIITWDSTFTAHGATTGVGDVSLNSLVIAEVLSTGKFGVNAQSLTYGLWNSTSQSTISTTTLGTTYSAPEITSAVLPVSKPTVTTIYNMTMTLDTIAVTPSGGGGGGGGGGSPSEGGILGGLQEFIDESFEFNMASKIHKVELGQTITDSISVSWNQPEEVNIIGIDAGRYNSWFGFQKTPFTLLGDSEGFSNAKIPYKIRIPEVYCDDTTGRTMCAEPILYEVPVLVTGQVNDEVFRGETVVKIDLSKTVQPALFAIFLAFAGGIGAIVYRARASSSSSKPSGKRTPKKKGSFLRELNKDYKK